MTAVTVVLPTHNRLPVLKRAVASVLAQSEPTWELIVVDDCSDDGTWTWLAAVQDRRVRCVRNADHLERSASRNRGLSMAAAPYVIFLDDDDQLLPHAVATLCRALSADGRAVAAVGARDDRFADGHSSRARHPRRRMLARRGSIVAGWQPGQGQWIARTDALRRIHGWPEMLTAGEDQWLWMRLERLGRVVVVPDATVEVTTPDQSRRQRDPSDDEWRMRQEFMDELGGSATSTDRVLLRCWRIVHDASSAFQAKNYWRALALYSRLLSPEFRGVPTLHSFAFQGATHALAHGLLKAVRAPERR